MRPLKLIMSAFGPYAEEEIIDFQVLKDKKIFLITGPTGAGKTTIFDGICYAIYGRASGDERESENFRSDFAEDDRLTFVELWFQVSGKEYYIKRIPQQRKKKSRGEGYTEQKSDAELLLPDGKVISGVNDVKDKINEIFGISYEQFKQIVMIPQGEFRELLSANSKEREAIFRKVFGTYAFLRVQELLDNKAKEIAISIKSFKEQRDTNIRNLQCGDNEEFKALKEAKDLNVTEILKHAQEKILEDEGKRKEITDKISILDEEINSLQKQRAQAIENNKKFQDKEVLEKRKISLEAKQDYYYNQEYVLNKARKALSIKGKEDYYHNRCINVEKRREALSESENKLKASYRMLIKAQENLKVQEGKEEDRKKLSARITELKKDIDKVKQYEEKNKNIQGIKNNLIESKNNKDKKLELIEILKKEISLISDSLEKLNNTAPKLVEKNNELKEKEDIKNKLDKLHIEDNKLTEIRKKYIKCKDEFFKLEIIYKEIKAKYEYMDEIFKKGQAGILAQKLEENAPCPVCGSSHHPSPAVMIEGVPTEEELKNTKNIYEEKNKEYHKYLVDLQGYRTQGIAQKEVVDTIKNELKSFISQEIKELEKEELTAFVNNEIKLINGEIETIRLEITHLDKCQKQLKTDTEKLKDLKEKLIKEEESLKEVEKAYLQAYGIFERESEVIKRLKEDMPQGINTLKDFMLEINNLEERFNLLERAYKEAQEANSKANAGYAAAQADKAVKDKDHEASKFELKEALKDFQEAVKNCGFEHKEDYEKHKLKEEEISNLDKAIKDYNEELKSIRDRFEEVIKSLENIEIVDITLLEEKEKGVKENRRVLLEEDKLLFSRMDNNKKLLKEIIKTQEEISDREESYLTIGELARVAKGDNKEKVSFERYVLAAYFDDIIEAANMRLQKMTSGRYLLSRIKERGKGNAQQGLELEVYDNYTGKARHVKTLSGGESFKASLSMALGLADVVQSYAGGISLETMFVDEGFGTLDPESLDNAISCLIDLQSSGRLVGIISHVPELKERIDARLEITPGMQGSHAEFIL
ncbi:exonuclease SbcC [Clostridium amylolyticum]|uniref:Nuclease SbcCD subunit C n=1 Tax=Clostridium amylolyticum TaxID=1121298 RepID=A0A1M6P6E4_9CLOT|nr:SMC family ATPase [Clostridium amylolyticum]SHK03468.1 exonuclease SbcC [Clostridium amylolyticum]